MCGCKGKCGCNVTSTTKGEKGDANSATNLGYKSYVALLSQSNTSAPTSKVLFNTLGGVPTFGYLATGNYTITLTGAFVNNKTWFSANPTLGSDVIVLARDTDDTVAVYVHDSALGTLIDDELSDTPIEIRVYS